MAKRIEIGMLTPLWKERIVGILQDQYRKLRDMHFADLRMELGQGKGVAAENGIVRSAGDDYGMSFGIRVIAGDSSGMLAPGYEGRPVGAEEFEKLPAIITEAIETAHRRARVNAKEKGKFKVELTKNPRFRDAAENVWEMRLTQPIWPNKPVTMEAIYRTDPMNYSLDALKKLTGDIASSFQKFGQELRYSFLGVGTGLSREFYANSLGVSIEQNFALSQAVVYGATGDIVVYDVLGHQRGPEIFTDGVSEPYIQFLPLGVFATEILKDVVALAACPVCPTTEKDVIVVTDPHYNALLVHEIVGHPVELDRGLKMETGYAGRTWLLRGLEETMVGKQIGSPLLNAYSDPHLPGYGHYAYDHEGTPAMRVDHIQNGIFNGFMNSLQTTAIFGGTPNGHWKATDASLVPLVRMSNTVFGQGSDDPRSLVAEVSDGYYLSGHATPSIAESRENFRISARSVWKIERGELTTRFRKGGMSADSGDYFMHVDGVGNDFRLFPVPNCGKGQPMQTKKLGNGGPTMRSHALLTGGAA